ncbi:hypothetical protein [uncultured Shimia sp.]|uniref:hypothetical protein n=1 Tax=uncultured Shimia sp. TaxID=573152 RepID=UPI0025FF7D46|nr:hypothetical protein [uncultured Shimia sp.]
MILRVVVDAEYQIISSDIALHGADGFGPLTHKSKLALENWNEAKQLEGAAWSILKPVPEVPILQLEGVTPAPPSVVIINSELIFVQSNGVPAESPLADALELAPIEFLLKGGGKKPKWEAQYFAGAPKLHSENTDQWVDFERSSFSIVDSVSLHKYKPPQQSGQRQQFINWRHTREAIAVPILDRLYPDTLALLLGVSPNLFELDGKLYLRLGGDASEISGYEFGGPAIVVTHPDVG